MWISENKHKELLNKKCKDQCSQCNYKAEWRCMKDGTITFFCDAVTISYDLFKQLRDNAERLQKLCEEKDALIKEYQQKYADEVQKRLTLIQQLKE